MDAKAIIAKRAAKELKDGDIVNLGIGLPTMLTQFLDAGMDIIFQSENGILGMGKEQTQTTNKDENTDKNSANSTTNKDENTDKNSANANENSTTNINENKSGGNGKIDGDVTNAGGVPVTLEAGASLFDSATSFGIIRGGHVDKTVLGALQVDSEGSLASHIIPGKMVPGMGGAMDLIAGAKQVIVVTTHTAKGDAPKILDKCTLPLTAYKRVNKIITELAVIECTKEGLLLKERHASTTIDEIVRLTGAPLLIPDNVGVFD